MHDYSRFLAQFTAKPSASFIATSTSIIKTWLAAVTKHVFSFSLLITLRILITVRRLLFHGTGIGRATVVEMFLIIVATTDTHSSAPYPSDLSGKRVLFRLLEDHQVCSIISSFAPVILEAFDRLEMVKGFPQSSLVITS